MSAKQETHLYREYTGRVRGYRAHAAARKQVYCEQSPNVCLL